MTVNGSKRPLGTDGYAGLARVSRAIGRGTTRREFIRRGAGAAALSALGLAGLSACGREEGESGAGSNAPVEIEYWHVNEETFGRPTIRRLINRFQKQNPGVTVRESYHGQDSYASLLGDLQTAQAANRPPDVAQIGYADLNYVANNFPFTPVDDLLAEYGDDGFLDNFSDPVLALGRADGKQAGLPYVISQPILFCNADLLSEAGVDPDDLPGDWEGWMRTAEIVRDELDAPGMVFSSDVDQIYVIQPLIQSNGGEIMGCSGGQAAAAFDGPQAVEALSLWTDWTEKGLVVNLLDAQADQAFLGGEVPVINTFTSGLASYREQASFDLRGAFYPRFGDKEPKLLAGGNDLFVFSEDEAKREAAWRFTRFLLSPEGQTTWGDATGYLPTNNEAEPKDDPIMREIATEQTPFVVPWVSFPGPNGFQATNVAYEAQQAALDGRASAQEAMRQAADEVNGLIEGQPCV